MHRLLLPTLAFILASNVGSAIAQPEGNYGFSPQRDEGLSARAQTGRDYHPRWYYDEEDHDGWRGRGHWDRRSERREHRESLMGRGAGGMMSGGMMSPGMRRMMFILMDADGDGTVSLQEFQTAHERIFRAMDGDKDGKLSMQEIQTFMRGERTAVQEEGQR